MFVNARRRMPDESENEDCVPAFSAVYHGANTLFGNYALLAIGVFQTMGGAGDILISCMLLLYKTKGKDIILLDHPTKIGLVVFEKEK